MVAGDQPLTEYTPSWHQKCRTLTKLAMPYYQRYHIFFVLKLLATSLQTKDYDLLLQSKRLSTYHPHRQNKNIPSSKTLFVYTICNNWSGFLKRLSVFFLDTWNFRIERLKMLRNCGRVTLQKCHADRGTYVCSMFHVYISYGKLLRSYLTRVQSLCYEALTGDGVLRIATASS